MQLLYHPQERDQELDRCFILISALPVSASIQLLLLHGFQATG